MDSNHENVEVENLVTKLCFLIYVFKKNAEVLNYFLSNRIHQNKKVSGSVWHDMEPQP